MLINKKRINSVKKYLAGISSKLDVYILVPKNKENLDRIGKSNHTLGEIVIPSDMGPVTKYNLDGKEVVLKNQEKEPRQIERPYHVIDWHGEDHYGICHEKRMCYPREFKMPPLEHFIVDEKSIRSELIKCSEEERLKHVINLFLEIYGYCEICDTEQNPVMSNKEIKELKWQILPSGKYPWEKVKKNLEGYFSSLSKTSEEVIKDNHSLIVSNNPDFVAIGLNSFCGYVVYGFSNQNIYIFESNQVGNATYVFRGNWEEASKLTKFDIIKGELCYKRIIHSDSWGKNIKELF